ncbi:FtsK/SpoIIIE domain-containing protein [Leptothoe spongobia]|uniref:ATP-binding protein n=1 Tax=Leptothoe spongobia TAU-MAC 1115 TaxID=1967444 RepID=A0A947DIS3_9CYAN|nr:FtsK/SpoIIIE domain-containing protein [Leptothoe spongobia]MBT9317054.1 ATP-binding protein [Leptothoe spongobia TAU-MAC 1115]
MSPLDISDEKSKNNQQWLQKIQHVRDESVKAKVLLSLFVQKAEERLSQTYVEFLASLENTLEQLPNCQCFLNRNPGDSLESSRQVMAHWNNPLWWHSSDGGYMPRLEGIAPPLLQVGIVTTLATFRYSYSKCPAVNLRKYDDLKKIQGDLTSVSGIDLAQLDLSVLGRLPLLLNCLTLQSESFAQYRGHTVIFSNNDSTRRAATEALESLALRAFATFPVRKLQGIFIDPISMGNTFPFKSLPEELRGKRTFTTSSDIQEELLKLITHTEQMIQNYLSRDYASIEDYNAAAEAIQEAYRYLFVADFPSKFDSRSLEYLNSLLTNGARAGVYAIIHIDETLEKPRNFNYDLFKDHCNVLRPTGEFYEGQPLFRYEAYNGLRYEVTLDKPPASDKFNCLTSLISDACSKVKVDTVPFTKLYPSDFWLEDSRKELRAPIGLAGARDRLEFWLGQNSSGQEISQSLLFGKPGAGKSFTLHSIINSLAMRYAPDELELYLLDYKEGVEFQIYVDPDRGETGSSNDELSTERALPHAKVISIESDREFGLSVLRKINAEFKRRADRWKAVANDITKVAEFRDRTHETMPRILVVIDEFQVLFEDNDAISMEINQIFNTIIKQGRAYGVHLLLASQSPNIKNISRSVYDLIDLRMAMQMNQNIAAMALAEGNLDAIDLLDRPGRIIYNTDFGRKGSNQLGQVADVNPDERKQALRAIQQVASEQNYHRPESDPLVLFDGRHPTRLRNNSVLTTLAKAPHWLSSAEIKTLIQEPSWRTKQYPSVAWLGEAMRIGDHSRAIFRRQLGSNLLIVGQDAEDSYGILAGTLTSLACCHQLHKVKFYIADMADEEDASLYWSSLTTDFRNTFEPFFDIQLAKDFPDKERHISTTTTLLQNVYTEFERRTQLRQDDPDVYDFGPSVFLVCAFGTLDCLSSLRPVPGRRGDPEMSDDAQKLLDIAAQGAELGIHLVLYIENLKVLNQLFATKERAALNHFGLRVCLTMPADDSRTLLGDNAAAGLPKLRAYFKNVAASSQLDKLKPYAIPTQAELSQYGQLLHQKNQ